jgi:hypothetical protein
MQATFEVQLPPDSVTVGDHKLFGFVSCSAAVGDAIMARVKSHSGPYIFGGSALRIELQTGQAPARKGREENSATPGSKGDKQDAAKSSAHHAGAAAQPFRVASYFGAFDPVHENHIRQALAACQEFHIDACFLCPNSDQGNTRKSIGVSQSERVEMLQRRCDGHGVLRAFNCGGRAWDWSGRCAVVSPPASFSRLNLSRSAVTQEVANLLLPEAAGRRMQLFQIIGQDSYDLFYPPFVLPRQFLKASLCRYEKAVKGSGRVLDSLRDPPRFLIVTPREGCGSADIQVPQAYRDYVFPLNGYRDELVCLGAPHAYISLIYHPLFLNAHASHNCQPLSFQVLSSTIIRGQLSSGVAPDPRALHPSVFEFIRQRGLYGCRPSATRGSESSVSTAASTPPSSAPKPPVPNPTGARASAWGPSSKAAAAPVSSSFTKAAQGGNTPSVSSNSPKAASGGSSPKSFCSPQDTAREINLELLQGPSTRRCHVVVLFGAHGTGKGTVAQALCSSQGYEHVSFGKCD